MYATTNFKTKKQFKDAVAAGAEVSLRQYGLGAQPPANGTVPVEGPWYPAAHTWYAQVTVKDGVVTRVK